MLQNSSPIHRWLLRLQAGAPRQELRGKGVEEETSVLITQCMVSASGKTRREHEYGCAKEQSFAQCYVGGAHGGGAFGAG
jgi:hypothetical protein